MTDTLTPEIADALKSAGVATVATQLMKRGVRSVVLQGVRPMSRGRVLVGRAVTVRFAPAREDVSLPEMLHDPEYPQRKAIEHAQPGDVIVLDCRGDTAGAALGDILLTRLQVLGAAGVVTDGGVRDAGAVAAMEIPIFAAGSQAAWHLLRHHAVELNGIVGCGGVQVRPGDVLLGDEDGVVCVPAALAESVARDAAEQARVEAFALDKVRAGAPLPGTYPPGQETLEEYQRQRQR